MNGATVAATAVTAAPAIVRLRLLRKISGPFGRGAGERRRRSLDAGDERALERVGTAVRRREEAEELHGRLRGRSADHRRRTLEEVLDVGVAERAVDDRRVEHVVDR